MKSSCSFSKEEKITGKKTVEELYKKGSSSFLYPLRISYAKLPALHPALEEQVFLPQVLITCGKKKFKKAHDRNRIKRLLREAYRTSKPAFVFSPEKATHIQISFVGNKEESLIFIKKQLNILLTRIFRQ